MVSPHLRFNFFVGVLVYFMVCGCLPFRAATEFDVYQKIKKVDYRAFPSSVSNTFKTILKAIFILDPNTRPSISMYPIILW